MRPLAIVPIEEVSVGYRRWMNTDDPEDYISCGVDYYVRPDGSARIARYDEQGHGETILPAGSWKIERMYGSFGSRGGREIISLYEWCTQCRESVGRPTMPGYEGNMMCLPCIEKADAQRVAIESEVIL